MMKGPRYELAGEHGDIYAPPVADAAETERMRKDLLAAHPQLEEFLADDDCAILCVRIASFLLLKGISESYYVSLD